MDILAPPPTSRYGPPPRLGVQRDGDGYTATCECKWLRWSHDEKHAATEYAKHVKGCKAHRAEVAA